MGKIKNRTIPAGGQFIIERRATKLNLISTTEPVTIIVERNHSQIETYENIQAPLYANFDKPFDVVKIKSVSGAQQIINFGVTDASVSNPRSQGGVDIESSVPLSIKNQNSLDKKHFSQSDDAGPSAGKFGGQQLFNPAGSGINLIVHSIRVKAPAASALIFVRRNSASLTGSYLYANNKFLFENNSQAIYQIENLSAVVGDLILLVRLSASIHEEHEIIKGAPYVIPPGKGLLVMNSVVNVGITVNFQWEEVSI